MGFNLSNFVASLTSAGVTPATIAAAIGTTVGAGSWQTQATETLDKIVVLSGNPAKVTDLVADFDEIQGIPATVVASAAPLAAAGQTPAQIIALVAAVRAEIQAG